MNKVPTNEGLKKKKNNEVQLKVVGGYIIPTNQKIEFPPENSSIINVLNNAENEILEFKLQGNKYIDVEAFRKAKEELKREKIKKGLHDAQNKGNIDEKEGRKDEEPSK